MLCVTLMIYQRPSDTYFNEYQEDNCLVYKQIRSYAQATILRVPIVMKVEKVGIDFLNDSGML